MADPRTSADTGAAGRDLPAAYPGAPRWVKVMGIIAIILVVLFAALHLSGRAPTDHNPGGHPALSSVKGQRACVA